MKNLIKIILVTLVIGLIPLIPLKSQNYTLDVPYRSDMTQICTTWCWAKTSQMLAVYYGNNIHLCDVLEYSRTLYHTSVTDNCCEFPESCCWGELPSRVSVMLANWSISSTYTSGSTMTKSEIQYALSINRPFAIHYSGHVVVAYGISNNDILIHDPGNGSVIKDYNALLSGVGARQWIATTKTTVSATACPLVHSIPGNLNSTTSTYKAINSIEASCSITSGSDISFLTPGDVILNSGFEISLGSSLYILTGNSITCP